MSIFENLIRKVLKNLGYELHRASEQRVSYSVFANLSQAYEHLLNESGKCIPSNDFRFKLLSRLLGTPPSEAYFIIDALSKCNNVIGDICEFGVAQGATSALIANEIKHNNKKIHLFDSFEGLPMPTEKDKLKDDIFSIGSMEAYTGLMSYPEDMVSVRLREISFPSNRVFIHKGFVDEVLANDKNLPKKVSFAYVDLDFYEPIKLTMEFLHQTTSMGAIIIVDDYNFFSTGVKTAVDEFIKNKNFIKKTYECFVPDTRYGYFAVIERIG